MNFRVSLLAAGLGSLGACTALQPPAPQAAGVRVQDILTEVQKTLLLVAKDAPRDFPPLQDVTLTLETEQQRATDGSLSLVVVNFGARQRRLHSQTLKLALVPPAPPARSLTEMQLAPFSDALAQAILAAARAAEAARSGPPPLDLATLEAKVDFVATTSVGFDLKPKLVPVSAELGRDVTASETQSITLTFKRRK